MSAAKEKMSTITMEMLYIVVPILYNAYVLLIKKEQTSCKERSWEVMERDDSHLQSIFYSHY